MLRNLGTESSIINQYVAEIRDVEIQKDSLRFRKNLERISELIAYELSKKLEYEEKEIATPLGAINVPLLKEQPVIASILRAGIPMQTGMLHIFDKAESAFIAAYRKYKKDGDFVISLEYTACPDLTGKTLVIVDPMLATGASIIQVWQALKQYGIPKHTYFISLIASEEGVEYVKRRVSKDEVSIWVAAVDEELTSHFYIVPGLGDAGDLAFGEKN